MVIFESIVILFLIIFQSIFGIGLLVFGTPTLMILGYQYADILSVLLPISCSISLIQIITAQRHDVRNFTIEFKKVNSKKIILFFIGSIHGISNLGGGFISIFSSKYFYGNKFKVRKAIAIAYLLFGITQILVLNFINVFVINEYILYYIVFALLSFYISNLVFKKINFINYSRALYSIVLIYGLVYIYLSLFNLY